MVEAAIIFPLVIAAVITVIYISVGLYTSLALQTSMHLSMRQEAGELSDTVERNFAVKEYEYEKRKIYLRTAVLMEENQRIGMGGLFRTNVKRQEKGRAYIIDEAELVRLSGGLKEVLNL